MIAPIDPLVHQQLERAVEQCGVRRADVDITYADDLQGEHILVRSVSLTDAQLHCLSRVEFSRPYPFVTFTSAALAERNHVLARERDRARAREWLRERGLLSALPIYDPNAVSVAEFARRIEVFCGIEAGSLLEAREQGITIKPEWAESQLRGDVSEVSDDKFQCLLHAISSSNRHEYGIFFGFIGNEAYRSEELPRK